MSGERVGTGCDSTGQCMPLHALYASHNSAEMFMFSISFSISTAICSATTAPQTPNEVQSALCIHFVHSVYILCTFRILAVHSAYVCAVSVAPLAIHNGGTGNVIAVPLELCLYKSTAFTGERLQALKMTYEVQN